MRQVHWIKKGYKEDAAFKKTEEELAANLSEARSSSAMLYEIRNSTSVRSFLDYYQEVAEYEGRLKVKRLENDLPKYLRSSKEFNIFENLDYINQWEKLTSTFATSEKNINPPQKSFITKAETLMEYHQEKANKYDGIQGLSDKMIIWSARDAYRHLKKTSKVILESLENYNVKLDENGEIDVSNVPNIQIAHAIQNNPMIKAIYKQNFAEVYEREEVDEVSSMPMPGDISPPEIKWNSENPYKQTYGRLNPDQIESQSDRIERLKRLWHHGRKNNTESEQFKLHQEAVKAIRSVRMKIDQIAVSEGEKVVFPLNEHYTKEELLRTHRVDINRMSRFLNSNKQKLFETEQDQVEYHEIKEMIKQNIIDENVEPVGYDMDFSVKKRYKKTLYESTDDELIDPKNEEQVVQNSSISEKNSG